MNKNIIYIISVLLIGGAIAYFVLNKSDDYKEIDTYVNKNYEKLEIIAQDFFDGKKEEYKDDYIQEVGIYEKDNIKIIDFVVSKENKECGFYYSETNEAVAAKNKDIDLIQTGNGEWIWSKTGDSSGKIKQIRDKWFYYESNSEK